MDFKIRLENKEALAKRFAATPKQVERASRFAVRTVTRQLHKRLAGDIPKAAGTSITGYRRVRGKSSVAPARKGIIKGITWMGTKHIAAKYGAGRMVQKKGFVKVGRHIFQNAFIFKAKSGYEGVFERVPGTNKIRQVNIELPLAAGQNVDAAQWAQSQVKKVLSERLRVELNKKV